MALSGALSQLIESGLIESADQGAEGSFSFRHALILDAAYASLLRAERRTLHGHVGRALEQGVQESDDPLELAPRLGEHFFEAGELGHARRYFAMAAEGASRIYANQEAIDLYRRALAAGDAAEDPAQSRQLLLGLGQSLELSGLHDDALAAYDQLQELASQRRLPQIELAALMARAKVHATLTPRHDPVKAQGLLEQARRLARDQSDAVAEARVLWNLMVLHTWGGEDFAAAIDLGRQSADLARRAGAEETLAFALNDMVYPLVATLQYAEARQACAEAESLWRRLGNLPMLVDSLSSSVLLDYSLGELDAGEQSASEAVRISEQIDNLWGQTNSRLYLGLIQKDRGRVSAALETMETAVALGDRSRHPGALIASRVDLALLLAELGEPGRGRELIDRAESLAADLQSWLRAYPPAARALLEAGQGRWDEARRAAAEARTRLRPVGLQWFAPVYLALAQAKIELAEGSPDKADVTVAGLLQRLQETPERPFLSEALRLSAQVRMAQGRLPEAASRAEAACTAAADLGSRWRAWPALVTLSQVRRAAGDADGASMARAEASALLIDLLEEIPPGSLRSSFRSLPAVSNLVED